MKMKYVAALLMSTSLLTSTLNAQTTDKADTQSQIKQAVMGVYEEELSKNPHDYETLFARANQYYLNGEYLKALDDVTEALKYTTVDDRATLFDEYVLRAKIYDLRLERDAAIADLKEANRIMPDNMTGVLVLGNMTLESGDTQTAKRCFEQLLRLSGLDYNALAGLAKVAVKEKNYGKAAEYANRAVELYPAEGQVYINRADVLMMMNDHKGAAQDIISALSVSKDISNALSLLVEMSNTDYDAVMDALNNTVNKAPKVGMFYYIRAMIAMGHNHYSAALKDLNKILNENMYTDHGVYYDCALANFNLCKYIDALNKINSAIAQYATNTEYYVLKAQIQSAMGMQKDGLETIQKSLNVNPNDIASLREKAILLIQLGRNKEANAALNEAILNNPTVAENLLLRAWLEKTSIKSDKLAQGDYSKALSIGSEITTMRGLALHGLGRDAEAKAWADQMVQDTPLPGGEGYYVAAVVYAQCGDADKALELLEGAFANGYGSAYYILDYNVGEDNIAPLRSLERFKAIVKQYGTVME